MAFAHEYNTEVAVNKKSKVRVGNKVSNLISLLFGFSLLFFPISSCAIPIQPADPPRILILGDSISMGYLQGVKAFFGESAVVMRPYILKTGKGENCEGTTRGVKAVHRWLALEGGSWDIIHFNFGLHDIKRINPNTKRNSDNPNHPPQASLDLYIAQLREITQVLRKREAKLIFATTTPVPAGKVRPHRDPADVLLYNQAAKDLMAEFQIQVNDLYAIALPKLMEIQMPSNVHFTKEGSLILARQVASAIRAEINP